MSKVTAKMKWVGGLKFEGTSVFGHRIATDGGKGAGGQEDGYKPTELLLYGIAGCAGIDVVRIHHRQTEAPLRAGLAAGGAGASWLRVHEGAAGV